MKKKKEKKTPVKLMKSLTSYVAKNGKAKTAVALGYSETNAITNWISRKEIPEKKRVLVQSLSNKTVSVNG